MNHLLTIDTVNQIAANMIAAGTPVRIELGGETVWASLETWGDRADELVAKHGGTPKVKNFTPVVPLKLVAPPPESAKTLSAAAAAPGALDAIEGGSMDVVGEARSLTDLEAARAAGFAPRPTVFRRGLRVIDQGVENATRSRVAHDAMPDVPAACADFVARIAEEARNDELVPVAALRMDKGGAIALPLSRYGLTERGFESLVGYHTGIGGAGYLTKCPPYLRAINVNHWLTQTAEQELAVRNALTGKDLAAWKPRELRLRTRASSDPTTPREVFGVVSAARYTPFDVDVIAKALSIAMPEGAKCRITYDGQGAIFDVQFHSNIQPAHYVAGEFFRAGIRIRTDDTGGGSIVGSAIVTQNLCLNLIIIDDCAQPVFRLRHTGNVEALAAKFRDGMKKALGKIAHFLDAWNYASTDERAVDVSDPEAPAEVVHLSAREYLAGIFTAVVERELVPVRGRASEVVPQLLRMWEKDTSFAAEKVTRSAVVNAFTRYAHEVVEDDFEADGIERSVAALLYGRNGRTPAPLPYLPPGADAE